MLRKVFFVPAVMLLFCLVYLFTAPVPVEPVSWSAPQTNGYTGVFTTNHSLNDLSHISLEGEDGPEYMALASDGLLYVSVAGGKILRMKPDGSQQEDFVNTGGRVLGFDFDSEGNLIAADAMKGLLSINHQGTITTLVDHTDTTLPIFYADAVVVAPDGLIFFTDASTRFAPKDWGGTLEASILDIIEQSSTGRVLVYDPQSRQTTVVLKGLSFANGLARSEDGTSLFVAETGKYRIWKVDINTRNVDVSLPSSSAKILIDNLPGYPDNLTRGKNGKIWVGLAKPRNAQVDSMAGFPFLRKVTLRLPRIMWPIPKAYGHVIAFSESGEILASLQDPTGLYPETTGVTETEDRLYIQSLMAHDIGWKWK